MGLAGAHSDTLPSVDDFDYSRSHRTVPIPRALQERAIATTSPPRNRNNPPRFTDEQGAAGNIGIGEQRFGATRNGSQHLNQSRLPPTRFAQAYDVQAPSGYGYDNGAYHNIAPINRGSNTAPSNAGSNFSLTYELSGEDASMMRKSSRMRQEQQDRLAQEAAAVQHWNQQKPPQLDPLQLQLAPQADDAEPDSIATFNRQYTTDPAQYPRQQLPHRPSQPNFSRPGVAAMPSSSANNSSSPSYAIRHGNAFAQAAAAPSSSPSVSGRSANGESVTDSGQRGESMTNRGRYSYPSNGAPTSVNSPRRVRRRKDPTPFKYVLLPYTA